MNITESNRLIAEFMAGGDSLYLQRDYITEQYYPFDSKELAFHISWDWLMPVVERVSSMIYGGTVYDLRGALLNADIDRVYKELVEIIEWYNQKQTS